jgi:hypothetical protein
VAGQDYVSLKNDVEAAGYFVVTPLDKGVDRVYLASIKFDNGHSGVSFWVAQRKNEWFIATYSPRIYRLPDPKRVAELAVLGGGGGTPYDFRPEIKATFQLAEVSEDDFDAL